jgi:hypothetical protein
MLHILLLTGFLTTQALDGLSTCQVLHHGGKEIGFFMPRSCDGVVKVKIGASIGIPLVLERTKHAKLGYAIATLVVGAIVVHNYQVYRKLK